MSINLTVIYGYQKQNLGFMATHGSMHSQQSNTSKHPILLTHRFNKKAKENYFYYVPIVQI